MPAGKVAHFSRCARKAYAAVQRYMRPWIPAFPRCCMPLNMLPRCHSVTNKQLLQNFDDNNYLCFINVLGMYAPEGLVVGAYTFSTPPIPMPRIIIITSKEPVCPRVELILKP